MANKFKAMLCDFGPFQTQYVDGDGETRTHQGRIDKKRVKRWVQEFRKMKDKGLIVPVPWGHRVDAIPRNAKVYLSSLNKSNEGEFVKNNATYIDELMVDDKGLWMVAANPPGYKVKDGKLVNESTSTQVAEFSVGIGNLTDRDGDAYDDVILHAAIVPYPVINNQPPIIALSASSPSRDAKFTQLLSRTHSMAKNMPDKDSEDVVDEVSEVDDEPVMPESGDAEADAANEGEGVEVAEEMSETPAEESVEVDAVKPMPGAEGSKDFTTSMDMLRQLGLDIPNDISEADGWRYLATALRTAVSMGAKFQKPSPDGDSEQSTKLSTESGGGPMGQVTAETPPILLSATKVKDPIARKLAQREEARMRADLQSAWDEAKKLGCPVAIADREAKKSQTLLLSLNSKTGEAVTPEEVRAAKLVLEIMGSIKGASPSKLFESMLSAQVQNPPEQAVDGTAVVTDNAAEMDDRSKKIEAALRRGASSIW